MRAGLRARQVANAVNLSTPAGLLLARWGHSSLRTGPDGLILAHDWCRRWPRAAAFTVGNVIITRHPEEWLLSRPALLRHEARHADQWACWLGLPFLAGYAVASAWSLARTGSPALGNPFERRAGLADGGYRPAGKPITPLKLGWDPLR
jgi:hypothetical protein